MKRTDVILNRTSPIDLTIGDCREGWFDVTAWCDNGCNGRGVDIDKAAQRWADRKLLDLMRDGALVCAKCGHPATFVTVSSSERAETILTWRLGDDAMPRQATS